MKRNRKSVKFNKLLQLVGRKMVLKDFKDKIRFLRTFKDRANFFQEFKEFKDEWEAWTTVIQMEKGINATPSRQFAAVQLVARSILQKDKCSTVSETDGPTSHKSFLHPSAAPVSLVSRYKNYSQQRGKGFALANRYM